MRYGGTTFRALTACGLTAALLALGTTAHAQQRVGGGVGGGGMSTGGSSGFGGGGGTGGGGLGGSSGGSSGFGGSSTGQYSFAGGAGNSFAGSSSSSFAGNGGGSSFSGGSGSGSAFSGSSGTGGAGSFGGGSAGGGFRGGAGTSSGVSTMNPFYSSYGNVLASGLPTGSSNAALGVPLYSNLYTTSTIPGMSTTGGGRLGGGLGGGVGGMGGTGTASIRSGGSLYGSGQVSGYGAFAIPYVVAPAPAAVPGAAVANPGAPPRVVALAPLPARMQENLQEIIGRSERITPATRSALALGLDGDTLVLRGLASNAAEAQTIDGMLRFAPGVVTIRNEMTWK
jgi:hypothetical protein